MGYIRIQFRMQINEHDEIVAANGNENQHVRFAHIFIAIFYNCRASKACMRYADTAQ